MMYGRCARAILRRTQFERDLDDEMQLHVSVRAGDLERVGVPRADAERQARAALGGAQVYKEH